MPIAEGEVFAEYTIVRLLGSGGMGEVYLAQHPRLARMEALKILPESVSADPEYRQRFAREAAMAASLWHPHIVAVHDTGEHEGQLWIAMDYVEGTDAAQLVRERYPHGMPKEDVFEIVLAIADALDYAHERYLLHRDVKPANILIGNLETGGRRILLADFGIAKAANEITGLTATNVTVGSVAYAAPEQLTGKGLDGRADQYALACTAFHLLTGRTPFVSSNPSVLIGNHLSSPPPRIGALRPDLASIENALTKGMAKDPSERFDACREFALALSHGDAVWVGSTADTQHAVPSSTFPAPPPGGGNFQEQTDRIASPGAATWRTAALVAIGVAAVLVVGLVAFVGARLAQSPTPPPTAAAPPPASPAWSETAPEEPLPPPPPRTVTRTATITSQAPASPPPAPPSPRRPVQERLPGDLGLRTPISSPACNGQGIVILGNVTTPGRYAEGVARLLALYPGSSYLRTDQSCPSLRQADDEGDPIYAVYRPAGSTFGQLCAAVRAAGGDAYGKWLNYTSDPNEPIRC